MKYLAIENGTIVDGLGYRLSVYFSGCIHKCEGCHNPSSWNCNNGYDFSDDVQNKVINELNNNPLLDGITLTGGDPLFHDDIVKFAKRVKEETHKTIWVYTGYTYESIPDRVKDILNYVDVMVDGKFDKNLYKPGLKFKGSTNQRIINVCESMKLGEIIILDI